MRLTHRRTPVIPQDAVRPARPARPLAVAVTCALVWSAATTATSSANASPEPQTNSVRAVLTRDTRAHSTGVEKRVWAHTNVDYGDKGWYDKPEPDANCGPWPYGLQCAWFYNDYPLNRLDADTTGPAVEILWVRPEEVSANTTFYAHHRSAVRSQIRAAASVFAASVGGNLDPTKHDHKIRDRTPRFITVPVATPWGTRYEAKIRQVAVPTDVMRRNPLQAHNGADTSQRGVMAYLEEHGFNQPDRRYILLMDYTTFSRPRLKDSYLGAAGNAGAAAAINMQYRNILWGPYGHGEQTDVDTSPGPDNFVNRGGVLVYINMFHRTMNRLFDSGYDRMAFLIAHEFGHTLGQNALSPHFTKDLHFRDREDIMGDSLHLSNQCGPGFDEPQYLSRFDCAHDDYWGQIGVRRKMPWARHRWDASNNEYLWGAPQSPRPDEPFSLAKVGIDCRSLFWCEPIVPAPPGHGNPQPDNEPIPLP